jgi:hypothetical protein
MPEGLMIRQSYSEPVSLRGSCDLLKQQKPGHSGERSTSYFATGAPNVFGPHEVGRVILTRML